MTIENSVQRRQGYETKVPVRGGDAQLAFFSRSEDSVFGRVAIAKKRRKGCYLVVG